MRILLMMMALATAFVLAIGCGRGQSNAPANSPSTSNGLARPSELPAEYKDKKSPFTTPEQLTAAAEAGKEIYMSVCSTCHGDTGNGDGAAGKMLTPKPTNYHDASFQQTSDAYLFWRISEGSSMEPFKSARSAMTPYKASFDEEQRWQLVAYIRSLKK